jgi:DNA-binding CsgD family transcriptional regulator
VRRLSSAGLEGSTLLRRVADALQPAVGFDAYCASTVDPATHLLTSGIAEGWGGGEAVADRYLRHVYFAEDLERIGAALRERRHVEALSRATGGRLERSLRYRELLRPGGFRHELGVLFADRAAWGSMDLIRAAAGADFGEREVALLRRVVGPVGAGLKSAALRAQAMEHDGVVADDAPGVVTIDETGHVVTTTPAAERWLAELGPLADGWREGRLPVALQMVVGALERTLRPATEGDRECLPRLRLRTRGGRWLTLHGALSEPRAGRSGERVIVIEPSRPEEISWLRLAAYDLSPREEAVVKLVARGCSTRQIAESLFIAEYTVQRHLSNIFEKVGVRGRRALVMRLFFEQLVPSLVGGE